MRRQYAPVRLQRLPGETGNVLLAKLEGDNPAGSGKDRPAVSMIRRAEEGIFAGVSSGGAVSAALRLSREVENAVIVTVVCDRGDRYLSTGVFK